MLHQNKRPYDTVRPFVYSGGEPDIMVLEECKMVDLSGDWRSYYRYQSNRRSDADFWGQHTLQVTQDGNKLKLKSVAKDPSHVEMELTLDETTHTLRGTWREETEKDGHYHGKAYEGTVSFRLSENADHMSGVWHGKGSDGKMNSDIWELARVVANRPLEGLSERWKLRFWWPSNKFEGEESIDYRMKLYQDGDTFIFESVPNAEKSYMLIRLKLEDTVAIGSWHETTSPAGEFKGAIYSGSGQLIVDPESGAMEGMWAGAGYDRDARKMKIYTGKWEIVPLDEN
jgi:hypothetical protein